MISEFQAGMKIKQPLVVRLQKVGISSNGAPFARGLAEDNSGCLPFICFEMGLVEKLRGLTAPTAFILGGNVDINRYASDMSLQLMVKEVEEVTSDTDISHLLPTGHLDTSALRKQLEEHIASITDIGIKKLVQNILGGETLEHFLTNPAGMRLHHAYVGGLLEHSVNVCSLALAMAKAAGNMDLDLIVAGALLHDVGKLREIANSLGFPYTTEGRLMGHIAMSAMLISEEGKKITELSEEKLQHLIHIVLAHHGSQDKGSPVACATKESFVVHYADELDSILNQFPQEDNGEEWEYNKMLQRYLYLKP